MRRTLKEAMSTGLLVALVLLLTASCGNEPSASIDTDTENGEAKPEIKKGVKPAPDDEVAVLEIENYGQIVIELYPNIAPQMVERFKKLAREGFYNGTAFHRVEPYVIQGGDPNSRDDNWSNDGTGGSSLPDLMAEFSDVPFEPGTVGAARASINSANSQFYITLRAMPQWAGNYTAFGKVIKGFNDAKIISGAPVRAGTVNPDPKIVIKSVTLQPRQNFAGSA